MKEYQKQIQQWWREGKQVALARVIQTWGSSPRPVGSCMFISHEGEMLGSVSGGCVEGAVVKEAKIVLQSAMAKRLEYGVSDEDAWAVGLSCGGKIQVHLQPWLENDLSQTLFSQLDQNKGCVLISELTNVELKNTLLSGSERMGSKIPESIELEIGDWNNTRVSRIVTSNEYEYFVHIFPPRSKLLVIGSAHITVDLIKLATDFNFETIVIDPRQAFAKNTTYTIRPDKIIQAYPSEVLPEMTLDAFTYAVILSHDPKIDDDALKILLRRPVAYIGALGSKKNHEKRMERLKEYGFTDSTIAKINAPIGVDINAKGAKEIALSIMGVIIKAKNQER